MWRYVHWVFLVCLTTTTFLNVGNAQLHPKNPATYQRLPSLREQAIILDHWRDERLSHIPELLKKHGVQAWLISQREYAEDTIWWSIKSAMEFAPHRRMVLFFHSNTSSLAGKPNPLRWVDNTGSVWTELLDILKEYNPQNIAINTDSNHAFGGGLHVGEFEALRENLGKKWTSRMVGKPKIGIEYVASRVSGQLQYYRSMQEITWALIEEAFSGRVIQPSVTTTEDVEWWYREKMQQQNLSTWNHPRVSVITPESFPGWSGTKDIINEGDLLHVDFGITAMGMNTDTQHMAYVLQTSQGETDAPRGLKEGLKKANRMQDIVLMHMKPGKTGNQVLRECLEQMKSEGIEGQIYSHPIGDWGHSAGAVMGFTNLPEYVPHYGELEILPNTYYSIELYAYHFVPERNETLRFRIEEDAYWVDEVRGWEFVRGRQEKFHLINWPSRGVENVLQVQQ
ncbi:Peptidase M24 domain-containing protein [Abortiporus biennis]